MPEKTVPKPQHQDTAAIKDMIPEKDMAPVKDSAKTHWVNHAPASIRPYLQLSRLDRPIGYWLLALPGWIGLCFAALTEGFALSDIKWAALILIGAVAMRGAGCTYNDIVDQDLDAQVERTALRPLPAGTMSNKQAWAWLALQCGLGLAVLAFLPRLAQIISLCSIPLVAAYPFMKRITWWPQLWLGFTFNWAVLVAYVIKTSELSPAIVGLYLGLVFWTVSYDTLYACQDKEDDALIGVKSTARLFGEDLVKHLCLIQALITGFLLFAVMSTVPALYGFLTLPFCFHLIWQTAQVKKDNPDYLALFKSNGIAALLLILSFVLIRGLVIFTQS